MIVNVSLVVWLIVVIISFGRTELPMKKERLVKLHRVPREKHIKEAKRRGESPLQGLTVRELTFQYPLVDFSAGRGERC